MEEIDKVDHLWIDPESWMKVGTYLKTYLNLYTSYAKKWKQDKKLRQKIRDRLEFKEASP